MYILNYIIYVEYPCIYHFKVKYVCSKWRIWRKGTRVKNRAYRRIRYFEPFSGYSPYSQVHLVYINACIRNSCMQPKYIYIYIYVYIYIYYTIIAYGSTSKSVPSHCLETPLLGSTASSQSFSMKRLTQSLLSLSSSKKKKPGIYYNLTLHTGSPIVCTLWSCSQWRKS